MSTFHAMYNEHRKQRMAALLTQAANIGKGIECTAARVNLTVAHEDYKRAGHLSAVQDCLRRAIIRARRAGWAVKDYSTRGIDVRPGAGGGMILWARAYCDWIENPTSENEQVVIEIYRYESVFSNTWTVWSQSDVDCSGLWDTLEPWERQEYAADMLHHSAGGARQRELALEALAEIGI